MQSAASLSRRAKSTKKLAVRPCELTRGIQNTIASVTTTLAKKKSRAPAERAIGRLDSMISLFSGDRADFYSPDGAPGVTKRRFCLCRRDVGEKPQVRRIEHHQQRTLASGQGNSVRSIGCKTQRGHALLQ